MFRSAALLLLSAGAVFGQDADATAASAAPLLMTVTQPTWVTSATTGLPFFAHGHCSTIVDCGTLGGVAVTTVTKTVPGVHPIGTPATITPTTVRPGRIHTVTLVPTATQVGVETVYITVTPGGSISEVMPTSLEPNAPATVWVFPGGPTPTSTVYVTSTLQDGHAGASTLTIPGPPPLVGVPTTLTLIPPNTETLTDLSVCPPQQTVTVVKQPEPAPSRNVTQADGSIKPVPASKFPCSDSDESPCRGTQVQGWTVFKCLFGGGRVMDGKTYPNPWSRGVNFDYDTILTVTDSWYQAEHWTVSLDGKEIGQTHENGFKNNMLSCTWNGDECIAKGFSHGSFLIPKGSHDLSVSWTDGPLTYSGGWKWTHGYGVYRFDRLCSCGGGHSEL